MQDVVRAEWAPAPPMPLGILPAETEQDIDSRVKCNNAQLVWRPHSPLITPSHSDTQDSDYDAALIAGPRPMATDLLSRILLDSGASRDLAPEAELLRSPLPIKSAKPINFHTAKGTTTSNETVKTSIAELFCIRWTPYLLKDSPRVASPGQMCMDKGCSFVWVNGKYPIILDSKTPRMISMLSDVIHHCPSVTRDTNYLPLEDAIVRNFAGLHAINIKGLGRSLCVPVATSVPGSLDSPETVEAVVSRVADATSGQAQVDSTSRSSGLNGGPVQAPGDLRELVPTPPRLPSLRLAPPSKPPPRLPSTVPVYYERTHGHTLSGGSSRMAA